VNSFAECPPYRNPFARAVYRTKVSVGVGVWTTRETKFSSVKTLLDVMIQGRFKFSKQLAHVDNSAYLPHARVTDVEEHVEELQVMLVCYPLPSKVTYLSIEPARAVQGSLRWCVLPVCPSTNLGLTALVGSISGKGEDRADDDDLAMACLLVVYWAFEILAHESLGAD